MKLLVNHMKNIIIILLLGMFSCTSIEPIVIEQTPVKIVVIEVNSIVELIDSADMYQYGTDESKFY